MVAAAAVVVVALAVLTELVTGEAIVLDTDTVAFVELEAALAAACLSWHATSSTGSHLFTSLFLVQFCQQRLHSCYGAAYVTQKQQ